MGDRTAGTDAQATAGSWGGGRTVYSARSAVKPRNRDETYIPQQGNRPTFDGSDTADEGIVSDDLHDILLAKHDAEVRKQKLLQVQGVEESAEWDYMFQQIIDANQCADP
jgi:hypothetical protein